MDENGVMGGAFGDMGGWGHTVTLCPLTETEPTGQDFGKCGSFAVVSLYDVTANVSKVRVRKSGAGFHSSDPSSTHQAGVTVSLSPVEGKNLAGVGREFTTASSNDPTTAHDERRFHDFGTMAAGAYELGLPDGWRGMVGDAGAAGALSPLGSDVALDVTPSTATLYGFVRNTEGVGLENVTVTVNGQTATTDNLGRYIVTGISAVRRQLFVNTARAGFPAAKPDSTNNPGTGTHPPAFAANTAERFDIQLSGSNNTVAITGTVTESGTGAPLKGVEIKVDGKAPLNAGSGQGSGKVTTADDGTYTAVVETQPFNDPLVNVTATKAGYHFLPNPSPVAAIAGANPTANFEGRKATEIFGRVTAPGGGMPRAEVTVTAYSNSDMTGKLDEVTTTETGTFSVFVPTLSGTVYLDAQPRTDFGPGDLNYDNLTAAAMYTWFDPPANRSGGSIAVIPGQVLQFGTFSGHSVQPRITSVKRGVVEADTATIPTTATFQLVKGEPTNTIVVEWEYDTRNAADATTPTSYSVAAGAVIAVGGVAGGDGTSATTPTETGDDDSRDTERTGVANGTTVTHKRTTTYTIGDAATNSGNYGKRNITVGVVALAKDATATAANIASASVELAAVASGATNVKPKVAVTGPPGTAQAHNLTVTWEGKGSPGLEHRILLSVDGRWLVFGDPGLAAPAITRATGATNRGTAGWGGWSSAAVNLASATDDAEWEDEDGGSRAVDLEDVVAVEHVRVDTRVTGTGAWKKGTSAAVSRN